MSKFPLRMGVYCLQYDGTLISLNRIKAEKQTQKMFVFRIRQRCDLLIPSTTFNFKCAEDVIWFVILIIHGQVDSKSPTISNFLFPFLSAQCVTFLESVKWEINELTMIEFDKMINTIYAQIYRPCKNTHCDRVDIIIIILYTRKHVDSVMGVRTSFVKTVGHPHSDPAHQRVNLKHGWLESKICVHI